MSTLPPDPYKILGVSKDAQLAEIRSRHRKLVLQCHPDKIQDPALKEAKQLEFQQVQQAYELLSNETLRDKYDQRAELVADLAKERERAQANVSASRTTASSKTPRREKAYFDNITVNVKDASPRASTFTRSPYGRTPPSKSWEDQSTGARLYEESRHAARKSASYEKEKPLSRDEERRRRKEYEDYLAEQKAKDKKAREKADKDRARDLKAREERDRARDLKEREEKDKRREDKKKAEKREREREIERKKASAEKARSRYIPPLVDSSPEDSDDDVIYEAPPSKGKKSGSGRQNEEESPEPTARERKYSGTIDQAVRYLARSGGKVPPSITRAQTLPEELFAKFAQPMAVPTPPPAIAAPFVPPPPKPKSKLVEETDSEDSDAPQRSSARPTRRMSHETSKSSGGKSSHKKSSSSRDHPIVIESGSPSSRIPGFQRSHTEAFARAIPIPSISRAETWYPGTEHERERQERSRSRPSNLHTDEDSEDDRERERRHRRSNRRSHSPEPIQPIRYKVEDGKTTRQKSYHSQEPKMYKSSKSGAAYIVPNSSSSRSSRSYKTYRDPHYPEDSGNYKPERVNYATQFSAEDIKYSSMPYTSSSYRSSNLAY
ncbi:hypothetical protein F5Y16DRAFT_45951 [Xylariaceae sp. FL0255]|nr:hypothetical protein F5Y16DRAFT_45951 [Xylariaceae sp. FL0255]